jgi:hypothetical protein
MKIKKAKVTINTTKWENSGGNEVPRRKKADSHCGKTYSKASVKLRLVFGYASTVPYWEILS